jgi:surface carbohydrate biosynthesis protein
MACDVLNLEWSSSGRDREVATAICHTLRRRGFNVVEECIFNYRYHLLKHRPRLLYVADPTGARINHEASLFADRIGTPSVCVDAEGDYLAGSEDKMFWAHIVDRRLRQRLKLQWSSRSRARALTVAPDAAERIKVTGAVGFDRYRNERFTTKEEWQRKYRFSQERMVGVAGWTFDYLSVPAERAARTRLYGRELVERFDRDLGALRVLLAELIRGRPETMFVLKLHPGVIDFSETEFAGLENLENVLVIEQEEAVGDCINACDVWMAYNSTTCIEAWLLGKPAVFVNPSGGDFPRSESSRGTPVLETPAEVDAALSEHEESAHIAAFDALEQTRASVLAEMLGWVDGKNHLRAAHYIELLLHDIPGPASFPLSERPAAYAHNLLHLGALHFSTAPRLKNRATGSFERGQLQQVQRRIAAALQPLPDSLSPRELAELEAVNP